MRFGPLLLGLIVCGTSWANPFTRSTFVANNAISAKEMNENFDYVLWMVTNISITTGNLANGSVTTAKISSGAVTTAEIADGTITAADLGPNIINSSHLSAMGASTGQVLKWSGSAWVPSADDTAGLSAGSVTDTELATNSVINSKIMDNAVTSAKIQDGTILGADLGPNIINSAHLSAMGASTGQVLKWSGSAWVPSTDDTTGLSAGSVTDTELATNSVINSKIMDNAVTSAKIQDGTIMGADLGAYIINSTHLTNLGATISGQVLRWDGSNWSAGFADTSSMNPNSVNSSHIVDGTIMGADLGSNIITSGHLTSMGASSGQSLKWDGATWVPANFQEAFTVIPPVTLSGASLSVGYADASFNGILSNTDWSTFYTAAMNVNNMVSKTGDVMTGHLTLPSSNPIGFEAAHVNYVTNAISTATLNKISNGGDSLGSTMVIGTNDANGLDFKTNGTTKVSLTQNGDMGIGLVSPTALLHVKETTSQTSAGSAAIKVESRLDGNNVTQYGAFFSSTVSQAGSGNYTAVKVNVNDTSGLPNPNKLLAMYVNSSPKFIVNDKGFFEGEGFLGAASGTPSVTCNSSPSCPGAGCTQINSMNLDYGSFSGAYTSPVAGVYEILVDVPYNITTGSVQGVGVVLYDGSNQIKLEMGRNIKRLVASLNYSIYVTCNTATSGTISVQGSQSVFGIRKLH